MKKAVEVGPAFAASAVPDLLGVSNLVTADTPLLPIPVLLSVTSAASEDEPLSVLSGAIGCPLWWP